jgi:hypothetical protein
MQNTATILPLPLFIHRVVTHCNKEDLLIASKMTGLDVNAEKTKYMVMSRDKNAGQNSNTNTGNNSFERMGQCIGNNHNESKFHS